MTSNWTSESIHSLKTGFEQGKSASVIGQDLTAEFGIEFTRNAVVGKMSRLKMGKKKPPIIFRKNGRSRAMSSRPRHKLQTVVNGSRYDGNVVEFFVPPEIDIEKTPPLWCGINDLDQGDIGVGGRCNMCRYPRGTKTDMYYCGLPTGGKSSWCSYHRPICMATPVAKAR